MSKQSEANMWANSLPQSEIQRVFLRCLSRKGWPSLERNKGRQLNKEIKQLLDQSKQKVVLSHNLDVLQNFPSLRCLVVQSGAKLSFKQVLSQLGGFQYLKEIEFKNVQEYIEFAHVVMAANSSQSKKILQNVLIKTHVTQNSFIKPCIELGKLVDLNVKFFCHHEQIDFSAFSTGWGMDMLADELEAQNIVFRNVEVTNEVQISLDQDYVLQNKSSFLSARFLVRNFMILPFLESFVVENFQLEFLVTYLVGTSSLSAELFQVLNQVKKLSVKIATLQNSQVVKTLPNVVNLELGGLIYEQEFPKMDKIQSLTISNMFKSSFGFGKDLNLINQFSTLNELTIGSNAKVDLNDVLSNLTQLKYLKILNLRFFLVRILTFDKLLNFVELEKFSVNSIVMQEGWSVSDLGKLRNLRQINLTFYQIKNKNSFQTKSRQKNQKYSYLSSDLDYFSQVISLGNIQTQVGNNIIEIHPFVKLNLFPQQRNG